MTLTAIAERPAAEPGPPCPTWCRGKCSRAGEVYEHQQVVGEFTEAPEWTVSIWRIDSPDSVGGWAVGEPVITVSKPDGVNADDLNLNREQAYALAVLLDDLDDRRSLRLSHHVLSAQRLLCAEGEQR
jgi:hypothetical protein